MSNKNASTVLLRPLATTGVISDKTRMPFQLASALGAIWLLFVLLQRLYKFSLKGQSESEHSQLQASFDPVVPLWEFDYKTVDPIKYRPFKKEGHDVAMGVTKTSRNEWLRIDRGYLDRINDRISTMQSHPGEPVFGTNDIVNPAIEELYEEIMIKYLPQRFPKMFEIDGHTFKNLATGSDYSVDLAHLDHTTMLRNLSENVEEDFFFMCPDGEGDFRLQGYISCFANGFLTTAKLGMSLREIHQPVPGYEKRLGNSGDRVFRRMEPGAFIGRMNWSIQPDGDDLFRVDGNNFYPEQGHELPEAPEDPNIATSYLRVEHQTLTCLHKTKAIMFCVRSYLTPLHDVRDEGNGKALADAIEAMPEKLGDYKKRPFWGQKVCTWLRDSEGEKDI